MVADGDDEDEDEDEDIVGGVITVFSPIVMPLCTAFGDGIVVRIEDAPPPQLLFPLKIMEIRQIYLTTSI